MRGDADRATIATQLVDLLLGGPTRGARAAELIGSHAGWQAALGLAIRWRVLPPLAERLAGFDAAAVGLERAAASSVRAQRAICGVQSARALHHADIALGELAAAGVTGVAIKGIAAIATLYGASERRMVSDVDIVIHGADLATARATLAARGYEDRSPPFERHVSDIALSPALHNFARTFVRDGVEIDLHWQFGPRPPAGLSTDRILGRAAATVVEGRALRVAGPIEAALLTSHHALRNAFNASSTVKDLLDLQLWWDVYGAGWSDELIATACESKLASSLLALLLALAARAPAHASTAGIALLERRLGSSERGQARGLLACFDDAVLGAAPHETTIALFAPSIYARSVWGVACREIGWKLNGSAPISVPGKISRVPVVRRSVIARVLRRLARGFRIGRELTQPRRIGSYRAIARAQRPFH